MNQAIRWAGLCLLAAALTAGCQQRTPGGRRLNQSQMTVAATFPDRQVTGVAVSDDGRMFVNFPYWSPAHGLSVAAVREDGHLTPYPNATWNTWQTGMDPAEHFICVQSVWADRQGSLWILDPASPMMGGVVPGGAKLVQVDLASDAVVAVYRFPAQIAPPDSYLNDVRIDNEEAFAYITDSGTGAIVSLDLRSGQARRFLAGHPSTQAERDVTLSVNGREVTDQETGRTPQIHADGIALSPDGEYLYYRALTGRTLYRIPTAVLRQLANPDMAVSAAVVRVADTVVTDGMIMDADGNLYHTALEHNAIMAYNVQADRLFTVIQDDRLQWPDSMSIGPDGDLYVTTSQIHRMERFGAAGAVTEPYYLYRLDMNLRPRR